MSMFLMRLFHLMQTGNEDTCCHMAIFHAQLREHKAYLLAERHGFMAVTRGRNASVMALLRTAPSSTMEVLLNFDEEKMLSALISRGQRPLL